MSRVSLFLGLGLLLFTPVPLAAKGPTVRIEISGPGLHEPVALTSPALLKQFAVWAGAGVMINRVEQTEGFIVDWSEAVPGPTAAGPRYTVSFYVKYANRPLESQPEQLAYVVSYQPDVRAGRGYVYLPGRGDEHFALNTRTIHRGREGQWFRATEAWDQAVMGLLSAVR
jgi:hypothetical protein